MCLISFMYVYTCHVCEGAWRPEGGAGSLGAGTIGSCKPPRKGAEN